MRHSTSDTAVATVGIVFDYLADCPVDLGAHAACSRENCGRNDPDGDGKRVLRERSAQTRLILPDDEPAEVS